MNILYCDPSQAQAIRLTYNQQERTLTNVRADQILAEIDDLVGQGPIDRLVLVNQASSFTVIRILVSIFNALAYTKQIPLYAAAATEPVPYLIPQYSGQPNIT